MFLHNSFISRR